MSDITSTMQEKIDKLPVWAQKYIQELHRERAVAVLELNKVLDVQTPSPFYIDDGVCTGEEQGPSFKRRYIQGYKVNVEYGGICLSVLPRDNSIELGYEQTAKILGTVVLQPYSYQQIKLFMSDVRSR